MEFYDHAYTCTTNNNIRPAEFLYKMSLKEVQEFVKLRVSNDHLFSGRRNSSMGAWRAILMQMGLQHKVTHSQAAKKWENLKKKYKELKNPRDAAKALPKAWPYFTLMDEAIRGLVGSAPIFNPSPSPISGPKKRKISMVMSSPTVSVTDGPEIEVSLNGDEGEEREGSRNMNCIMQEVEDEWDVMHGERRAMERERLVLQRERAALDREGATLERDRASLERERATVEREKAVLERERAMVETDRDAVSRDRLALEQEKARVQRLKSAKATTTTATMAEEVAEYSGNVLDTHVMDMDRKERFLYLFEKLIESL